MTPPWITPFLVSLRRCGVVAQAARDADVPYGSVYALRDKDGDFAAAWADALEESYDALEAELLHRAVQGTEEPLTYQGCFTYVFERDAQGGLVMESYEAGTDKAGNPIIGQRPKHKLDPDGNPIVQTIRKKSDALLMFALKGRRKRVYADRTEVTGADGAPVAIDATARAARLASIMAAAALRREFKELA